MTPGPRLRTGLVVFVLGAVVAISAGVYAALPTLRGVLSPTIATPGTVERQLGAGTWVVFEQTASGSSTGPFNVTDERPVSIDPTQVEVTDTSGAHLVVRQVAPNETITRGKTGYTSAVDFHVVEAGRYRLRFDTDCGCRVIVSRPLGTLFSVRRGWMELAGAATFVAFVGVMMMLVGFVRRDRRKRRAARIGYSTATVAGPGQAPAGWYPDPVGKASRRYWDGARWTEDVMS